MRILIAFIVALVISALVSIGGAWACATWSPVETIQCGPDAFADLSGALAPGETRTVEFDGIESGFGVAIIHPVTVVIEQASSGGGVSVRTVRASQPRSIEAGWPVRSVSATFPGSGQPETQGHQAGLDIPEWVPNQVAGRRLPFTPRWTGVAINAGLVLLVTWPTLCLLLGRRTGISRIRHIDGGMGDPDDPLVSPGSPLYGLSLESTSRQSGAA
ncbi:MAG: hypothetical protein ACYTGR_08630 [Planctomycetota bacterium]|jgi:hypothetical protein